jgi:hypothetical protein
MNVKTIRFQLISACAVVLLGCPGPLPENDAGVGGGGGTVTGGGTGGGATGGGSGGGSTGGGGGSATGGGGGGGTLNPCDAATHDLRTGTFTLGAGATIMQTSVLPAGITQVAAIGTSLFGLTSDDHVKPLGSFPTLTAGANLASIRAPGDDAGTIYAGAYLAASGTELLAGYTKAGAAGSLALIETTDGGVSYVNAPGNYDVGGASIGFLINGIQVGTNTGAGAYVLSNTTHAVTSFATFDAAWLGSGYAAVAANGVALIGYYGSAPIAGNYVRAAPPSSYLLTLQNNTPFPLAPEVLVAAPNTTDDVMDLAAAGNIAIVAFGSFDANFTAHVSHVDRVPLTLSGSGVQTVTVGTANPLLSTTDTCTNVLFIQGAGTRVLVGLEDKNGRRLLDIAP